MRRLTTSPPTIALAVALLASPAFGQQSQLDRVEALVAAGDYAGARSTLERWWQRADDQKASVDARVRATMLRAQLTTDPLAAERDYLAVALGHPTSPYAPRALLTLGQGLLATGDLTRAGSYLQRLTVDYPGNPLQSTALLWLVRVRRLDGNFRGACALARNGVVAADKDADLVARFRREQASLCPRSETPADSTAANTPAANATAANTPAANTPAAKTPADAPAANTQAARTGGRFAVQSGAFRQTRGAEALAARLRNAGYTPRLVFVPGSGLLRVRVGNFTAVDPARALARRIRSAGFAAVVVGDGDAERARR